MNQKKGATDVVAKLKAQSADAFNKAGIDFWYIVLCTDATQHADQIRTIASEFTDYDKVKIVLPRNALAFLEMSGLDMSVTTTKLLCAHDNLLKGAIDDLAHYSPHVRYLLVNLTCLAFGEQKREIDDNAFLGACDEADEYLRGDGNCVAQAADALSDLEGIGFVDRRDSFVIDPTVITSLCAVYFVTKFRGMDRRDLVDYLAALLHVAEPKRRQSPRRPRR